MPDITMCRGEGCNIKETCYRYKAQPSEYYQSYFLGAPFFTKNNCEYHIEYNDKKVEYDEDYLNELILAFKKNWEGTDANKWLDNIRKQK